MNFKSVFKRIETWFRTSNEQSGSVKANVKSQTKERPAWIVCGGKVYHLYPECPSCKRSRKPLVKTTCAKARDKGLRECGMCREMIDRALRL